MKKPVPWSIAFPHLAASDAGQQAALPRRLGVMWQRLWIAWACIAALVCAAGTAWAVAGAPAKPHQGTSEFSVALNVCAFASATVQLHSGKACLSTTGTSDVPDAARGAGAAERLVIGRGADLAKPGALKAGERALSWPSKMPNAAAEWKINSGLLRQEMQRGLPIRDISPGNTGGMFLNAERNLLQNHGWTFDASTSLWMPPVP